MTLLERVRGNLWLLGACRDWRTLSAMKGRTGTEREAVLPLRLRALEAPILYRSHTTDISVAWELFHQGEYECTRPWDYGTVVDCGANVGMFAAFALAQLGRRLQRYVGVEPDRAAFALLERQVEQLGIGGRSRLIHAAAWHSDGAVSFDDAGPSWGRHVSASGAQRVRALCIESILDAADLEQCDLLKLDIEGGERHVLPRIGAWGPRVRTVVAELHDGLDYAWFAALATDAGFEPFPPGRLFRLHPGAVRRYDERNPRQAERVSSSAANGNPSTR
ncbi:MAG: FkbM family methyltransferase [Planctomycetota bacterium]|nr:MAG: FkbM family methyltransferase [Planctomycetota bacterium]